jgi:pimeloyl-ACP methyl ester carboxylesterase
VSEDGVEVAFATCGEGFPVVKAPNAATHLKHDRSNPVFGHWISELSRSNRLVRFDMRGFGMSDWDTPELTLDALISDFAAVIDASGISQCDLVGLTHGAAIAIGYAARNPTRVRRLVLLNSFAAGWAIRADPEEIAWRTSLMELNRKRWQRQGVALGERFVGLYFPSAAGEIVDWYKERFDELSTVESIERFLGWGARIDVRKELASVRAPTLIFHSRDDGNAEVEVGREVAAGIAGARFVELESANHFILNDEPAWPALVRELRPFLAAD